MIISIKLLVIALLVISVFLLWYVFTRSEPMRWQKQLIIGLALCVSIVGAIWFELLRRTSIEYRNESIDSNCRDLCKQVHLVDADFYLECVIECRKEYILK